MFIKFSQCSLINLLLVLQLVLRGQCIKKYKSLNDKGKSLTWNVPLLHITDSWRSKKDACKYNGKKTQN